MKRLPSKPAVASAEPGPGAPPVGGDTSIADLAQRLLDGGLNELSVREQRVISTIANRRHVSQNVNRTVSEDETVGDRIADRVARFGGSWTFIIIFVFALLAWVALNTFMLTRYGATFDAYPFIFLNLVLSMVAALQAPIILMSQNRQARRDRIAAGLDYEVNLKAELEIMALHDKLDALRIEKVEEMMETQGETLRQLMTQSKRPPD